MPSTIDSLFSAAGIRPGGMVRCGDTIPATGAGVYVVALTNSTGRIANALKEPPLDLRALQSWIKQRPRMSLDGVKPQVETLAARLASSWLSDEVVLYIGHTTRSLQLRLNELYGTPLGAKRPHAAAHFLKTLSNLDQLWVHFAEAAEPRAAEEAMLNSFVAGMSKTTIARLHDPAHPMPFANLEWPEGVFKRTGLRRETGLLARPSRGARLNPRVSIKRAAQRRTAPDRKPSRS